MARRIHWHPPAYAQPRPRCGAWHGTAAVTRDADKVTCQRCRRFMVQQALALEPMRGRPIRVTYKDGETEQGPLIDAVTAGLELCRITDGKRILASWPTIKTARFVDEEDEAAT